MDLDSPIDFETQSVDQLSLEEIRQELQARGLSSKGNKRTVTKRLKEHLHQIKEEAACERGNPSSSFSSNVEPKQTKLSTIRRREKCLTLNINSITEDINALMQSPDNVVEVKFNLQELSEQRHLHEKLNDELMGLIEDEDVNEECKQFSEYQRRIRCVLNKAQRFISEHSAAVEVERANITERRHKEIKLPKFDLPLFSGDILKFTAYWDQFRYAVHENRDLSAAQKFTYLRASLKGTALQAIDGFETTSANYEPAVDAIFHRFGRKRIIVASLVKSIVKCEIKDHVTAATLRQLHDTLQNRIRALEGLGFKSENNPDVHMVLIPLLEMKLPQELAERWEFEVSEFEDTDITIDAFFKFLNRHVLSREAGQRIQLESNSSKSHSNKYPSTTQTSYFNKKGISSASALFGNTVKSNSNKCGFCNKPGHESVQCHAAKKMSTQKRWEVAKENKLCFNCLKFSNVGHNSASCRHSSCTVEGCGQKHNRLLHSDSQESSQSGQVKETSGLAAFSHIAKQVLLQTALAFVTEEGFQEIPVRILFDTGSQRSYIKKSIAEALNLDGPAETLSICTFGGDVIKSKKMARVKFNIKGTQDTMKEIEIEALAINRICAPLQRMDIDLSKYQHLQGITLADNYQWTNEQVDILIGTDNYYRIIEGEVKKGEHSGEPTAVNSKLGWILCGSIEDQQQNRTTAMFAAIDVEETTTSLKCFWDLESIGIVEEKAQIKSIEEIDAITQFNEGLSFDGTRYKTSIPWKRDHLELTDNYHQAVQRLKGIENSLKRNEIKQQEYSKAITQYINEGFAEEVEPHNVHKSENKIRYLPHHAVYRRDKSSTKTRIVFDASAKLGQEPSLNDCILQGPALQPNLVSVLIRFRNHPVALMTDIKKMFLQIELAEKDRDVHRYLWREMKTSEEPRVYRMQRVTFGVNCSPFLAISTVQSHAKRYQEQFPAAAKEVLENMYVDDCLTGAENINEAIELQSSLSSLMRAGGFQLVKWASNSDEVIQNIKLEERAPSLKVCLNEKESIKALGLNWDTESDCFFFDVAKNILESKDFETKRSLLSLASKVFDPMGLLSPYVLRAKLLFQELWTKGLQWDEKLPQDILTQWRSWKEELLDVSDIQIPRCFTITSDIERIEIHGFGDASLKAYGAAVYIRIVSTKGGINTKLVMSKTRVAPLKRITLPRIELLASVINARLVSFVPESIKRKINQFVLWTDSSIALYWIKGSSSKWKPFDSLLNSLQEIKGGRMFNFEPAQGEVSGPQGLTKHS